MNGKGKHPRGQLLALGLGNELLTDDGVGVHVVRRLEPMLPPGALAVEAGTSVLGILHLLETARAVLAIDAVDCGAAPGTLCLFDAREAETAEGPVSLHQMNLLSAWRLMPGAIPPPVWVLGVQPGRIDYGMELSPEVDAMAPSAARWAARILGHWHTSGIDPREAARAFSPLNPDWGVQRLAPAERI